MERIQNKAWMVPEPEIKDPALAVPFAATIENP